MDNQQNMNTVKKLYEEVYSKGNLAILPECCANNCKLHDAAAPNIKGGLNEIKEREMIYKTAFPNKQVKIEDILTAGDKVIVRWTCKGTHKGDLQGIPATNKNFQIWGISIYKVENGKITEMWQSWDRLGLLEQIGEIQPTAALHR